MNKNFKKDFMYTWKHKMAVLQTEKRLTKKITLRGILHDTDKLFLYLFFDKKKVSRIHRKYSKHHTGNHRTTKDIIEALIDWESSRLTKTDKPETPKEYLLKCIPEWEEYYKPVMKQLGLW